jgi:DUF1365 family protein
MNSCLYTGTLRHRRRRPRVHEFRYRVFMFYLDLDELTAVGRAVAPFSVNRFNLASFYDRDHLDRRPGSTKDKVLAFARRGGIDLTGGKVYLLTSCRMFGYVFNPISLYYCHDHTGDLRAVVAEVHNTFGEQYIYLLDTPLQSSDAPASVTRRYRARKAMHVSPFISMEAVYDFHLAPVGDRLAVGIVERESGRHVLDAQLWGRRVPLTTASLGRVLLTHPLMTVTTMAAIHFQALRLYLKGVPVHRQPPPSPDQREQRQAWDLGPS